MFRWENQVVAIIRITLSTTGIMAVFRYRNRLWPVLVD